MKDKRKYSDRAKYLIKAVDKRRKKIKEMAIKYKGSKCCICGYDKYNGALEFHHLDEKIKDFSISTKGHCRSWDRVKKELDIWYVPIVTKRYTPIYCSLHKKL